MEENSHVSESELNVNPFELGKSPRFGKASESHRSELASADFGYNGEINSDDDLSIEFDCLPMM